MMFPDRKTVERLRKQFPAGCRVVLGFENFTGKRMPLAEWAIVKAGWVE